MYYIYHISGIKIGCTENINRRMLRQNFTEWEILEEHTDGWLAGDREIELQKEYGYIVDTIHYMTSLQNSGFKKGHSYGKQGNELKQLQSLGGIKSSSKYSTCPHCNTSMKLPIIYRWHFDNCKQKKGY